MPGPPASLHLWHGHSHEHAGITCRFDPGVEDPACSLSQVLMQASGNSLGPPASQPHQIPVVAPLFSMGSVKGGLSYPEG